MAAMDAAPAGSSFLTHAPEAVRRLAWAFPADPQGAVDRAELALGTVCWHDEVEVAHWVVANPFHGAVALATLADDPLSIAGCRVRDVLPELFGLSVPSRVTTYEHEPSRPDGRSTPLLDRVIRALVYAIDEVGALDASARALTTAVLLFCDVAKGGTVEQRNVWRARLGVDGTVHNEDSAVILDDLIRRVLGKVELSDDGRFAERARVLVATSGLVGMRLRGEVSREAFGPLLDCMADEADAGESLTRVWSIVNHCETQAVRAGLWTTELARAFTNEERAILMAPSSGRGIRPPLAERIARMREGALITNDPVAEVELALERLRGARSVLESRLGHCNVWYAEAAIGGMSLDSSVRLLLHLSGAALAGGIDATRSWHLDLLGIVGELREADGAPRRYHVRLLETILESTAIEDLMNGKLDHGALLSFPSTKGGEQAISVTFRTNEEASALLTLLTTYERKASAEFHRTLKSLCDLYQLRKDDFDRVHNEAAYLSSMNAARSDKARLLDFVRPGLIVEIGPGGGVVLDLLADRYESSRIVGVDASIAVVQAHDARHAGTKPTYEVIHGDAFELASLFPGEEITTVIFCSVLHEIFSYVEWGQPPKRFCLEAVDAVVGAAYRALAPGGRIVVRDGVAPDDEPRVVRFRSPAWRRGLDLFAKSFEPRQIRFEPIGDDTVRIGARDLYEFLTTFTWGPDSFPYEVREQRAILPRTELVARLIDVCKRADPRRDACEISVPGDLASYLQPGYPEHIAPHVTVFHESGERELRIPDVNGVLVIEKR